jgi:transcriptional regulator with PAS, ATPase and Fis domain
LGQSRAIAEIRAQIRLFARAACDVLITGETGTGKELVAKLLHASSARANGPLLCLNCGEFTNELVESELFGYEVGAFTGAQKRRVGLLQSAHGGIVFLDEIGDMTLPTQVKLLRVLETREVRRLGSNKTESIDIRVIAATNRNIETLIEKGQFRSDFYQRIRVGRIHRPPLRARREDIPILVERFLMELSVEYGRPTPVLGEKVERALLGAAWLGNARELRHELAGAFALSTGRVVEWSHLSDEFRRNLESGRGPDDSEASRIREALENNYWNVSLAAGSLEISRQTLYRKIDRHKIPIPKNRRRARGGGA